MYQDADRPLRWEPRVLWDQVGVFDATTTTQVRLERNHFRNSEDRPYVLTHMLIAPVGVPTRRGAAAPVGGTAVPLQRARVWVQHPDVRKVSRTFQLGTTFRAEQSGMPRPNLTDSPRASSVFGAFSWMFERPIRVSPMVRLVMRMTACRRTSGASTVAAPLATPCFYQENPVNVRQGPTKQLQFVFENGLPGNGAAQAAALGCAFDVASGTPPTTVWSDRDFYRSRRQDPALRGGVATESNVDRTSPSYLTGFNILIDQLALDGATGGDRVNAPVANTMGLAIGSSMGDPAVKRDSPWWRGFCPMSLCCPTQNDIAIVHRLPEPMRLQRGQALEVAVELCNDGLVTQTIGVSFVGYTEQEA